MLNSRTLRPGRLVGLKTTIRGGVEYRTTMIEEEHLTESGAEERRWETLCRKADPDEHERAKKARSKARQAIVRPCAPSDFGYLCPEDRVADLEAGLAEARRIADAFNATAQVTPRGQRDDRPSSPTTKGGQGDQLGDDQPAQRDGAGHPAIDVKMIRDAADKASRSARCSAPTPTSGCRRQSRSPDSKPASWSRPAKRRRRRSIRRPSPASPGPHTLWTSTPQPSQGPRGGWAGHRPDAGGGRAATASVVTQNWSSEIEDLPTRRFGA